MLKELYMGKKEKAAIKRPLILYVIIVIYVVAPAANIFLSKVFFKVPLSAFLPHLFQAYGILAGIWLLTAPVVGIGFYFINKISWYVFIWHSGLVLIDFGIKWVTKPLFYWQSLSNLHNFVLLTGNLALVFAVGYIVQKDFRAPYFQALPRSWRESERISIIHWIILDGERREITDLSEGGCFIADPDTGLNPGDRVMVHFIIEMLTVNCEGEVRRKVPDGLGIQFLSLPAQTKRALRQVLKKRFALRYEVDLPCSYTIEKKKAEAKILNISRGGCYIQTDVEEIDTGMPLDILSKIGKRRYLLQARIAWVNRRGDHEKPVGFGCKFSYNHTKLMRLLISVCGRLPLTR